MKRWIVMCAAALLATPLAAQDVTSRSGGIIVKQVIKDGKVVNEDVEVFGDLDEDEAKRYLKALTRSKKSEAKRGAKKRSGKKARAKAHADGKRLTLRFGDEEVAIELPEQVRELLEGLHGLELRGDHGGRVHIVPPRFRWHHGEDVDIDLDIQGLHEQMQDALRGLKKHGLHFHFDHDHHVVPGLRFRAAPKGQRYRLRRDRDGDRRIEVEIEREDRAPRAKKRTSRRADTSDRNDAARKIDRLEAQIRSLRKELQSLKKQRRGSTVRTSNAVWL